MKGMKGVSNIVSFILLFTLMLTVFYVYTSMQLVVLSETMSAFKDIRGQMEKKDLIEYNLLEYNTLNQKISLKYVGAIPEYDVRLICVRTADYNDFCVVRVEKNGVYYSVSMVEPVIVNSAEYNLASCGSTFVNDCSTGEYCNLVCYITGRNKVVPSLVERQ